MLNYSKFFNFHSARRRNETMRWHRRLTTTQPRHSQNRTAVLTAAFAAILLIYGRSLHKKNRVKTHASMVLYTVLFMAELLL